MKLNISPDHAQVKKVDENGIETGTITVTKACHGDVTMPPPDAMQDEGVRADTTLESLAKLKPAFKKDGTTTAGV